MTYRLFTPANDNAIDEESIGRFMYQTGRNREDAIELIHDLDWVIQHWVIK